MMEVHDCFSITELTVYETCRFRPGKAIDDILDGFFDSREGSLSAGRRLKCFGHPSGLRAADALRDVQPAPGRWPKREG